MSNQFAHGYALLIGVGETAETKWSLPVTVKDVQALKTVLTDANLCAYDSANIRLLQNEQTTRSAIIAGLTWLQEKAASDRNATIVVYYSGHGCFDQKSQCYYLLQHDFKYSDIANTALSAAEFTQALRQIQAKRLWVVIDSCHAEGMATSKGELPADFIATALPKGVIDDLKQGEGRAVFTSSRGNQSSWIRPDKTMSLYTYHLIEALQGAANKPGDITVMLSNLINHLGKTVPESARTLCRKEQTPFFDTATEDFPIAMLRGGKGLAKFIPDSPKIMTNREVVTPALARAKRALAILEEQAASYGIRIPVDLQIELEEKRRQVIELESRHQTTGLD
ncbi:caspase family protein [Calothrix sp. FACHB-1219]|uniref:caspase family protein n=1 Tax=unclassified Calothrix TaxID=2619626 RepID=UPI001689E093|nr:MULTISPECIES: caspase family protein [unclassified Calothrix]MBD2203597.1 caspase family protein [Calothrix sp. FACHB-168]MBD2219903.1 caspase family protein [Calothrix sp. FACHB-1219]